MDDRERMRGDKPEDRTERIVYGDLEWATTPEKKAMWDRFWKEVIAQAELDALKRQSDVGPDATQE